jgi:hypothetical protein
MKTITLNRIKQIKSLDKNSWKKLLKYLNKTKADDTEITFKHLLDVLGVGYTLWIIDNCVEGEEQGKRNMCADIVESVLHIWEDWAKDNLKEYLDAPRNVINALRSPETTEEELRALGRVVAKATGNSNATKTARNIAISTQNAANKYVFGIAWEVQELLEKEKLKEIILKYFN